MAKVSAQAPWGPDPRFIPSLLRLPKEFDEAGLVHRFGGGNVGCETGCDLSLGSVLEDIGSGRRRALGGVNTPKTLSHMLMQTSVFPEIFHQPSRLFLSASGEQTPLHRDLGAIVSVQLLGCKRWTLLAPNSFAPAQAARPQSGVEMAMTTIEALRWRHWMMGLSWCAQTVKLNPGDGLYVPSGWWHEVCAETLCVSVSVALASASGIQFAPNASSAPGERLVSLAGS
jgi:hypothetical protein